MLPHLSSGFIFFMLPVHAAAFSLCISWGSLEARVRHISWGSLMGVRPQSVQAQGSHRDRVELPEICILRESPNPWFFGKPGMMASLLPNNKLRFPWKGGFWIWIWEGKASICGALMGKRLTMKIWSLRWGRGGTGRQWGEKMNYFY